MYSMILNKVHTIKSINKVDKLKNRIVMDLISLNLKGNTPELTIISEKYILNDVAKLKRSKSILPSQTRLSYSL